MRYVFFKVSVQTEMISETLLQHPDECVHISRLTKGVIVNEIVLDKDELR